MLNCIKIFLIVFCLNIFATCVAAENSAAENEPLAGGKEFIFGKEEGWFWKKTPPEPPEVPEKEPETVTASTPPEKPLPPPPVAAKPVPPEPFTVAWFRENIQKIRDRAIDDPTPENVRAYFYAQRIMLDKASRLTEVARVITATDPVIDESGRRSTSTFAALAQSQEANKYTSELIREISQKAGIFFFFRGRNCDLCVRQAEALKAFQYMTGMKILPVSVDGAPLPGNIFPDFVQDSGQAKKLQIENTPALALAIPPSETRILSFAPVSADALVSRTILIAHDSGLISEKQYRKTLPYNDNGYIDSNILKDMPQEFLDKPDLFINYILEKTGHAGTGHNKKISVQEKLK